MATTLIDVNEVIERQNVWRVTVWVVVWAMAAMIVDGYDLPSLSFAAPHIIGVLLTGNAALPGVLWTTATPLLVVTIFFFAPIG